MRIGGLPLQVGIRHGGTGAPVYGTLADPGGLRSGEEGAGLTRGDVVVTGRTEAVADLQIVQPVGVLEPLLARQTPRSGGRGEVAPLVALGELRRTVGTHRGRHHIFTLVVVVHATEEREEHVVVRVDVAHLIGVLARRGEVPGHLRTEIVGETLDDGGALVLTGNQVLHTGQDVQAVVLRKQVLEIVLQGVRVADLLAIGAVPLGQRQVLIAGRSVARSIGRYAVEAVAVLLIVVQTGLDTQTQIIDDLPLEGGVGIPGGAGVARVVVPNGLHGVYVVVVIVRVVLVHNGGIARNGRIDDGVLQTRVTRLRTAVVQTIGAGTSHLDIRVADVEIERHALVGLELTLEAQVVTLVVGADHDRLLVVVGITGRPRELLAATGHRDVMVEHPAFAAEHLVHPVVAGHARIHVHILPQTVVALVVTAQVALQHGVLVLRTDEVVGVLRNQRILVGHVLETVVEVVIHRDAVRSAALGSHDDNAVRTARTVDGGREGILQHVDRLDIRSRDVGDALHGETVDDVERRAVLRDRTGTAHADLDVGVGITLGRGHLHTGHTARHGLRNRGDGHLGQRFAAYRRDRTHDVTALHGGITHDDHFVHRGRGFAERDVVDRFRSHQVDDLIVVAHVAHLDLLGGGGNLQREFTVHSGAHADGRSLNHDRSGHHGPHRILNSTGNGTALGRNLTGCQRNERQNECYAKHQRFGERVKFLCHS